MRRRAQQEVEHVPTHSTRLLTIGPLARCWADGPSVLDGIDFSGSFLRVQPPAGADESVVAEVLTRLRADSPAQLTVSRARRQTVPRESVEERRTGETTRSVVLSLAEKSQNRERLRDVLSGVMDEVGL